MKICIQTWLHICVCVCFRNKTLDPDSLRKGYRGTHHTTCICWDKYNYYQHFDTRRRRAHTCTYEYQRNGRTLVAVLRWDSASSGYVQMCACVCVKDTCVNIREEARERERVCVKACAPKMSADGWFMGALTGWALGHSAGRWGGRETDPTVTDTATGKPSLEARRGEGGVRGVESIGGGWSWLEEVADTKHRERRRENARQI